MNLRHRAIGALRLGRPAAARDDLAEALRLLRKLDDRTLGVQCLETYAAALAAHPALGEHRRAARLIGATEAQRASLGLSVVYRADLARGVAAAKAALGESAFAAALEQGRTSTLDEPFELALTPPDPAADLPAGLTERETEVLALVARGPTNAGGPRACGASASHVSVPAVRRPATAADRARRRTPGGRGGARNVHPAGSSLCRDEPRPARAVVLRDGREVELATVEVLTTDLLLVRPGVKILVDRVVEVGESGYTRRISGRPAAWSTPGCSILLFPILLTEGRGPCREKKSLLERLRSIEPLQLPGMAAQQSSSTLQNRLSLAK